MVGLNSLAVQSRQRPGSHHDTDTWVAGSKSYESEAQIWKRLLDFSRESVLREIDRLKHDLLA